MTALSARMSFRNALNRIFSFIMIKRRREQMIKQGFDNDKYLAMQSDHIRERISKFGDKLYLEFGGKL